MALGIALGTTIWAGLSLAGLGLLFAKVTWLYGLVKLLGAGYLIYIGLQTILSARRPAAKAAMPLSDGRAFRRGLLTDLSNPKAAAFFTSLLSQGFVQRSNTAAGPFELCAKTFKPCAILLPQCDKRFDHDRRERRTWINLGACKQIIQRVTNLFCAVDGGTDQFL